MRLFAYLRLARNRAILAGIAAAFTLWATWRIIQLEDAVGVHYGDVFFGWLVAVAALGLAAMRRPELTLSQWAHDHRIDLLALTLLTGLAAALRFVRLGALPDVIDGDEGLFGMAGLAVYDGQFFNPFATFHGAGTLHIHAIAGWMRLLGPNPPGLRVAPAVAGVLAVPAVYLLGRELFNRRAAAVAAVLMAASHYHVHFSRIVSVTYLQGTFFNTLALYLLLSGLRRDSASRMMLAGIVLGVYFMIYLDARMMLGVMALMLLALALVERPPIARNARRLLLMALVFVIVAAPMLLWAIRHPQDFNARFGAGPFNPEVLAEIVAYTGKTVEQLMIDTPIAMFTTLFSRPVADFYFAGLPVLDVVSGILFLAGLGCSLAGLRRAPSLVLNVWLWVSILAVSLFTLDEYTVGYHLLFVFPAVCLLVGLGLDRALEWGERRAPSRVIQTIGAATLLALVVLNLNAYFGVYLPACRFGGDPETRQSARLGQYLGTLDPAAHAYLLTDGSVKSGTHPSLDFLSGRKPVTNVPEPLADAPAFDLSRPTALVAVPARAADLDALARMYPGGRRDTISDCGREVFTSYRIESATPD